MLFEIDYNTPHRKQAKVSVFEKPSNVKASSNTRVIKPKKSTQPNFKSIKAFAQVHKVSPDSYKIRACGNALTRAMIVKKLKAFSDIEIQYDEDLDNNDLIHSSKKPLWTLSQSDNGVFTLSRAV